MSGELPEGWAETSIGTVVDRVESFNPETEPSREFGYVDISSVDKVASVVRADGVRRFRGAEAPSRARRPIRAHDVLFSNVRTNLRNIALVQADLAANLCSTGFTVLRAAPSIHPRYLLRWVQTDRFTDLISATQTGTHYPATTDSQVLAQSVRLAPMQEQRRIVEKVEALLEQVNRAKARLDRVPVILKRFRQAVLAAACSGELTREWRETQERSTPVAFTSTTTDLPPVEIPGSWRWVATEDLCDPDRAITYGVIKLGDPVEGGVPTLRSSDVRALFIDERSIKRISPEIAGQYRRTFLKGGEVLVTVRGSLGGIAVVPARMAGFNISREVAQLPICPGVRSEYAALAVASRASQTWLTERAKGVAYTGINIEDLRQLPLAMPPREEQDEIVRRVDALFALADAIERRLAAATARAEKLPQAILAKAFAGELVPTEAELARAEGRDYETAEALLARFTAERAAAPGTTTRKRRATKKE